MRRELPLVVMYHGVARSSPRPGKFLDLESFDRHMDAIQAAYNVVPLADIESWISQRKQLPRRPLAITFDDAYANLLGHALPELARRGIPATVFSSSAGLTDPPQPYWFDEVDVRLSGFSERSQPLLIGGRAFDPALHGDTQRSLRAIRQHLKAIPKAQRDAAIHRLREDFPVPPGAFEDFRAMSPEELRRVAAMGFDVGGHTVSHVVLASEPYPTQREEIVSNFEAIRDATGGRGPAHFAYPNGKRDDYDAGTIRILRETGYRVAVTTEEGFVLRNSDPYRVPRISAGFFAKYGTEHPIEAVPLRVELAGRLAR
jgi:peptidoglycan/xylan/chitin deacetylase (PgdA/CDA1 family)